MSDDDARDPSWENVLARSELSAECKITWWLLWRKCRRRPNTELFSFCELAALLGRTERAPRESVKQLRRLGFVDAVEFVPHGVRLYVKQPQDVLRPDERLGFTDRQPRLFERQASSSGAEEPGADVVQHPPADVAQDPPPYFPLEEERAHAPLLSTLNSKYEEKVKRLSTSALGGADVVQHPPRESGPVGTIGVVVDARVGELLAGRPGDELAGIERLADAIERGVGDPKLRRSFAVRVARAVHEHELPARELEGVLAWVAQVTRSKPGTHPAFLFVGAVKRALARQGVEWPTSAGVESRSPR